MTKEMTKETYSLMAPLKRPEIIVSLVSKHGKSKMFMFK